MLTNKFTNKRVDPEADAHPLKAARIAADLSRVDLATLAGGISPETVAKIERRDSVPRRSTLIVLAIALDIPPSELEEVADATG